MRNIVSIATYKRTGSGVIFECEVEEGADIPLYKDEKSYLILTNYHVIQGIDQDAGEKIEDVENTNSKCRPKNQKEFIDLGIKDINGEEIDSQYISYVTVQSGKNYDEVNDVAAILVIIKDCCQIPCEKNIWIGTNGNRTIETQGYPHVFEQDTVSRELCMTGKLEKYNANGMGLYKIQDDYHGYSDISDKELMDGLSGSPVYTKDEYQEYVIGLNQSVCNIGDGKNPFKIVYFIEIGKALEWLRSQSIVLYEYKERHIKLVWIYQFKKLSLDLEKPKRIVLIGGSGVGKSSFVQTLCQHGNVLNSVGDGQTTRATIHYHLLRDCEKPEIQVTFMSKDEFVTSRMDNCRFRLYELSLCNQYGMTQKDILQNPTVYLQDIYEPLRFLGNEKKDLIKEVGLEQEWESNLTKISQTLYLCQEVSDQEKHNDLLMSSYDGLLLLLKQISNHENNIICQWVENGLFNKKIMDEYLKMMKTNRSDLFFQGILTNEEKLINFKIEKKKNKMYDELRSILFREEGFFDVSEFYFLNREDGIQENDIQNNEVHNFCEKIFREKFEKYFRVEEDCLDVVAIETMEPQDEEPKQANGKKKKELEEEIESFYKEFYDNIINILREKEFYQDGKCIIELVETTKEERDWITRCLRKAGNDSLTSIVDKVEIKDAFSNDYVYALNAQKITSLFVYDTCGIDHVSRCNYRLQLQNLLDEIKSKRPNGKEKYKIDGVIYLKKLSSEKPTELETMLPIVNQLDETIPIYCLFTATDHYYLGKENLLRQLRWDKDQYDKWKVHKEGQEFWFPKAIQNMHENRGISEKLDVPASIQTKIWRFLVDHMYPYASHYSLGRDEIISMNRKTIVSIVRSILMEEWMLGFIWDMQKSDGNENSCNKKSTDSERTWTVESMEIALKEAIQKDLENMFQKSSQTGWEYRHPSTVRANFIRIYRCDENYNKNNNELGLNRMYIDRWDSLLKAGYRESFLSKEGKTIHALVNFGFTELNAYNLIVLMESEILDIDMGKWKSSQNEEQNQESEFRTIFKEMYNKSSEIYDVNVFESQQKNDAKYGTNYSRAMFLNKHCDFQKGLKAKNGFFLNKFVDLFYKKLKDQLENRNKVNLQNLRKYDLMFKESLDYIKKVIQKYANGDLDDNEQIPEHKIWELIAKNLK